MVDGGLNTGPAELKNLIPRPRSNYLLRLAVVPRLLPGVGRQRT